MQVLMSQTPVELEPVQAFKLQSMGLVRIVEQQAVLTWELFRQYFCDRLRRLEATGVQQSRLATIVSTNVVNFNEKLASDRERTLSLLYQDFQLITQLCQQFEGQVIKSIDDSLLIYFPSVMNAVNCAQEIQLALRRAAQSIPDLELTHRIGIHFGDVSFHCTDVAGTGVKVATRVQAEAPPGGICISQTVYEAVRNFLALQPLNLGQRQFDEIEQPIKLYQLTF
jgi:class 3 adenylate cyclase